MFPCREQNVPNQICRPSSLLESIFLETFRTRLKAFTIHSLPGKDSRHDEAKIAGEDIHVEVNLPVK